MVGAWRAFPRGESIPKERYLLRAFPVTYQLRHQLPAVKPFGRTGNLPHPPGDL
jgi:hypothetical protein